MDIFHAQHLRIILAKICAAESYNEKMVQIARYHCTKFFEQIFQVVDEKLLVSPHLKIYVLLNDEAVSTDGLNYIINFFNPINYLSCPTMTISREFIVSIIQECSKVLRGRLDQYLYDFYNNYLTLSSEELYHFIEADTFKASDEKVTKKARARTYSEMIATPEIGRNVRRRLFTEEACHCV